MSKRTRASTQRLRRRRCPAGKGRRGVLRWGIATDIGGKPGNGGSLRYKPIGLAFIARIVACELSRAIHYVGELERRRGFRGWGGWQVSAKGALPVALLAIALVMVWQR